MKKGIIKKIISVMLAVVILSSTVVRDYEKAEAEAILAPTVMEWIMGLLMGTGMVVDISSRLSDAQDLDDLQNKLNGWMKSDYDRVYDKYMASYPNLPTPDPQPTSTPIPDVTQPIVTVAPIDPDSVEVPLSYEELMANSMRDGFIEMTAPTYYCLKEAVKGFWDKIIGKYDSLSLSNLSSEEQFLVTDSNYFYYFISAKVNKFGYYYRWIYRGDYGFYYPSSDGYFQFYFCDGFYNQYNSKGYYTDPDNCIGLFSGLEVSSSGLNKSDGYFSNVPFFTSYKEGVNWVNKQRENEIQKEDLWVNPNLKDAYDSNSSLPDNTYNADEKPPVIILPTLDALKDLYKKGQDDPDNKPIIVQQFINDHTKNPETNPQPTTSPDNPNPTSAPDVTQVPDLTITPDPDNPDVDDGNPTKDYKSDLRLVFPFCIPFDLVHLIETLDAEPEAPVFTIPIDIEFMNPWTGQKIIDYHEEFSIDMSEFDSVVRILKIFEIVFFIIGLLLITRSLMIRG